VIEPLLRDDALLRDVLEAPVGDGFAMWWLGQSGFLVKHRDRYLCFDPYLSDSLTVKYANSDKPHVRMTARAIDPARLGFVDVVTSSHNHTDHLDPPTLTPMLNANPDMALIIPEANRRFVCQRLGIDSARPVGLNDRRQVEVAGFSIHGVPAAHEAIERDERGRCRFMGYVARFGNWSIYHSGDTMHFEGIETLLRPHAVDVAILPINGHRAERRVAGNLWGRQAAKLAKDIGARLVVPCHYEMFEFNTEPPDEFIQTCEALGQEYRVLRCGERLG
jgi:L-ascorbate metabolism protein UlaG (beta-lactamase superfamily)